MNNGILFGPYGTALLQEGQRLGIDDLSEPINVLHGDQYVQATSDIAQRYAAAGARQGTTNTYRLRNLLHKGNEADYAKAVDKHAQIVVDATKGRIDNIWFAFGTYGDGYDPNAAPDIKEAMDFHRIQLAAARKFAERQQGLRVGVLFETISAVNEAIAIAQLASHRTFEDLPVVASFVTQGNAKLFDETPISEAVAEVDSYSKALFGYSVNCCPIEALEASIRLLGESSERLRMAYPNANSGDPRHLDGCSHVVGVSDPSLAARNLVAFVNANPNVYAIGGCCGYGPDDIARISKVMSGWHLDN